MTKFNGIASIAFVAITGLSSAASAGVTQSQDVDPTAGNNEAGYSTSYARTAQTEDDSFSEGVSMSDSFGGTRFGARYDIGATLSGSYEATMSGGKNGEPQRSGGLTSLVADAHARAYATLFSNEVTILDGSVIASGAESGGSSVDAHITVLGRSLWSDYDDTHTTSASIDHNDGWTKTFVSARKSFMVGPVPVTVSGSVTGSVGISYELTAGRTGITASATPYVRADVSASAAVNIVVASFGVRGNLNLFDLSLPFVADASIDSNTGAGDSITYSVDSDLVIRSLSGNIELFVTLLGAEWDTEIADWNGVQTTLPLVNESDSICLGASSC